MMPANQLSEELRRFDDHLKRISERFGLAESELISKLNQRKDLSIPISIFSDANTGILETLIHYLSAHHHISMWQIGQLLHLDPVILQSVYRTRLKSEVNFHVQAPTVPISIFQNRRLSYFEALVHHLHRQGYSASRIQELTNRDGEVIEKICRSIKYHETV